MDPNITLQDIRNICQRIHSDYVNEDSNGVDQDDAYSLVECITNLDAWLSKGGFVPNDWKAK